jgi:uncharacterized membrane protein
MHNLFGRVVRIVFMVIGGVALAVLIAAIFGFGVMYLWNWLMPALFGLKTIGYWEALGIVLLAKLIFGDFGHHHGGHCRSGKFRKKIKYFHRDYPEVTENYEEYREFWEKEGSKSFSGFLARKRGEKDGD